MEFGKTIFPLLFCNLTKFTYAINLWWENLFDCFYFYFLFVYWIPFFLAKLISFLAFAFLSSVDLCFADSISLQYKIYYFECITCDYRRLCVYRKNNLYLHITKTLKLIFVQCLKVVLYVNYVYKQIHIHTQVNLNPLELIFHCFFKNKFWWYFIIDCR